MLSIVSHEYQCVHCGEWNETEFDPSGGLDQTYVEDCAVCCRPLVIHIRYNAMSDSMQLSAEEEG